MLRSLFSRPKKNSCRVNYSKHIKAFKYLSAPVKPNADHSKLPPATKIDQSTIENLEKVSLVGFENDRAVKIVEDAIRFADQIFLVNTEDTEPLVTVLENECLHLRDDTERNDVTREDLLSHCTKSVENYYITPLRIFAQTLDCSPDHRFDTEIALQQKKVSQK